MPSAERCPAFRGERRRQRLLQWGYGGRRRQRQQPRRLVRQLSGLSNDASFTYYTGAPSMLGTAYAHTFAPEDRAFMNVGAGVDNSLSFFYSSPLSVLGAVRAYSGLNGSGALLGTFDLLDNASAAYDQWTAVTFSFGGTARSFDFTGSANVVGIDNIAGVAPMPEPSTVVLVLIGGAAVLATRRRERAS